MSAGGTRTRSWTRLTDVDLLGVRLDRLGLRVERSALAPRVKRLYRELETVELAFRPHVWLSTDWFSPEGVAGIAMPFYLAHPRLTRLERSQMLWAEGSSERGCMRLLRHEAGHALDTAFRLSRRPEYRAAFGKRSEPYGRRYRADPRSQAHVRHLDRWYSQSHPTEDFAETFAVWLAARGRWRTLYAGTPALAKLETVSAMMKELRGARPRLGPREETESLRKQEGRTLGDHYRDRRWTIEGEPPPPFEASLRKRFLPGRPWTRGSSAATLLNRVRKRLVASAARELGCEAYAADQVVGLMVHRARELGLLTRRGERGYQPKPFVRMIQRTLSALQRGEYLLTR